MHAPRRLVLLAPFALAGCGNWRRVDRAPREFAAPRFDHLTKLNLNVASLDIEIQTGPGGGDIGGLAPTPPIIALRQMAQDRLGAMGANGRAVFTIRQASIFRVRGGLDGALSARLDLHGPDGLTGYAEARVSRRNISDEDERAALHELVRQLMEQMNVEFEFQVRRALRDFLVTTHAADAVPESVDRQELTPPR